MLEVLHKQDCVFKMNMILVESILYHGGKAIIVGESSQYGTCLDERVKFMDIKSAEELVGKKGVFSSIKDKIRKRSKEPANSKSKTILIIPDTSKHKIRETEEYILLSCDNKAIGYIIVYLNKNFLEKSSGYERLIENCKKALF